MLKTCGEKEKKKSLHVLYEIFYLQNEDVLVSPTKFRGLGLELG